VVKAFPYDFQPKKGSENGKNKCSTCMVENSKRVKECQTKSKVDCPCGLSYYCTDLKQAKHELSKTHTNGMKQAKINRGKVYTRDELRRICSMNGVKDYGKLNINKMMDGLIEIANIQIPADLM